MADYKKVYQSEAKAYEELVEKEDYQGNLFPAINGICSIEGKQVVEFGAGTGRLTRLLAPKAKFVHAFDGYSAMVDEGNRVLAQYGITNVSLAVAENKSLPMNSASADVTIAGWTFGHCISWFPETWKDEISSAVNEMIRITRRSGKAIILETLGTGSESPAAPNEGLARYYELLENEFGFIRTWIRTDYCFTSKNEADRLTLAFFGKTYPLKILQNGAALLPECTGIWHRDCSWGK